MTILYFIIALGILIFIHEFGHFLVAKRNDVQVDAFSLGFGPRLFGFKRGETDYRVSMLPVGGYVKMVGEDSADASATNPRSFAAKGIWTRVKIVIFGPVMNLVLCLLIMPVVFMIGRTEPVFLREEPVLVGVKADSPAEKAGLEKGDRILSVDGKKTKTWEDVLNRVMLSPNREVNIEAQRDGEAVSFTVAIEEMPDVKGGFAGFEPILFFEAEARVGEVSEGSPAQKAGIIAGDKIVSYAGSEVSNWTDFISRVSKKGDAPTQIIVVERNERRLPLEIQPVFSKEHGRYTIGVILDQKSGMPTVFRRFSFVDSVVMGTKENFKLALLTFDVLKKLVTLKLSYKVLGGPIIIAKASAIAAASGISSFIYFLAFLSLQLGILNLLPIPVLDGGQLVYFGIEALFGRPMPTKIRFVMDHLGLAALISLMLVITYNDIDRIWGIKQLIQKIF